MAVLSIIGVTLAFPALQMNALNQQSTLLQAKRLASVAYRNVDLNQPDWARAQSELQQRWLALTADLGLPMQAPVLVPATPGLWKGVGFRADAASRLSREPRQLYYWHIDHAASVFRFAMAVRGRTTDAYPRVLRGIIEVRLPIPKERGAWNWIATFLAGSSGAVLAIIVFYMVMQRLVLTPLGELRRAADLVSAGQWDVQPDIKSGDEFEGLADAFNKMLAHVREAREQQNLINRSLDVRLGELAEANVGLYESNRLKSEFIANVSHELRTPLVSILGFAELLRDMSQGKSVDMSRLARYADSILISGRSLLEIINDLLDLAKIEAGRMELHVSEFSMGSLGEDMMHLVRPLADKRAHSLEFLAPDAPLLMRSDSGKIKQILYNLLSNAIKFTPNQGRIELAISQSKEGEACIIVRDSGPGIPEDKQGMIFEKFRQLDSSTTREYEGTGLGLAITRELVQILGGRIQLRSDLGRGAEFTIELPLVAPADAQRPRMSLS